MSMIKRLAMAISAVFIVESAASAHEYAELAPLEPELRSFLVTLLEDANAAGHLDGDAVMDAAKSAPLSARLAIIIDSASDADMRWLETVCYKELEHPAIGRVPAGVVLQLFSDLVDAVAHAEVHKDEVSDAAFAKDIARLQTLSNTRWGQ